MNEETLLTKEETLNACSGNLIFGSGEFYFSSVETDSRNVKQGSFFVPLIGEFQDGHKFIPQAVENGATCVFVAEDVYQKNPEYFLDSWEKNQNVKYICVKNTLTALQNIAEKYVSKFPNLIKLAITGSSGKTTSKEMLVSLLSQKYNVICNQGNFNSETGLPLSVFNIRKNHELGIFEMGMNRKNEISEISKVLKAQYALITNIGTAHIGILGSRQNIAEEKSNVFNYLSLYKEKNQNAVAFIPKDDDFCDFLSEKAKSLGTKIVYYGENSNPHISDVKYLGLKGTGFKIDGIQTLLSIPGKYNFKNILGAISVAEELGLTSAQIAKGVSSLKSMFGRSQVLEGKYLVIQDCYNANPDSMEKAVDFFSSISLESLQECQENHQKTENSQSQAENLENQQNKFKNLQKIETLSEKSQILMGNSHSSAENPQNQSENQQKKILVLGDMLELGKDSELEHKKLGEICSKSNADILIFVGNEIKTSYETVKSSNFKGKLFFFEGKSDETIEKLSNCIRKNAKTGSCVLIKASRGLALERITKIIQKEADFD